MTKAEEESVKSWNDKISKGKEKFKPDFERMEENGAFVSGRQWPGQKKIQTKDYVANVILKVIKGMEAALYARNPKVSATKRKRLDFEIWDEKIESLQAAVAATMHAVPAMTPEQDLQNQKIKQQAQALLKDVEIGKKFQQTVDKVAATLEIVDQWMIDNIEPDFVKQMKQLVFRALVCCVGYVEQDWQRQYEHAFGSTETESSIGGMAKKAQHIIDQHDEKKIKSDSKEMVDLHAAALSIVQSALNDDQNNVHERICLSFPQSTSIIPDPDCTNIDGWVGADWISHEYITPVDKVNEYFELTGEDALKMEGGTKIYDASGEPSDKQGNPPAEADQNKKPRCALRHVWVKSTKSEFWIVDGHKKFIKKPAPIWPETNQLWPIHALVFNNVESNESEKNKVSIFPPSHVDMLKSAQVEWNKARDNLSAQRDQNVPFYGVNAGKLPESDMKKLQDHKRGEVIPFKGLAENQSISDVVKSFQHEKIDPAAYDVAPMLQDLLYVTTGEQSAPGKKESATSASIQEHARNAVLSSEVANLDSLLSVLARQRSEILLGELTPENAKRIAGRGAAWPSEPKERQEFIQAMYLDVKAASSGRPNQALRVANMEKVGPLMLQAGANPKAMVRALVHALDETMDEEEFFPLVPQPQPPPGQIRKAPVGANEQAQHQATQAGHPILTA